MRENERLTCYDKYTEGKELQQYGKEMWICPMESGKQPVTSDLIDMYFEDLINNRFHIAGQIEFVLPGLKKSDDDGLSNEFHVFIPVNDSLKWLLDEKDGVLSVAVKFRMSGDQAVAQTDALRNAGVSVKSIRLSDDEYIDFGEVNCECVIHLKIPMDSQWGIKEQRVRVAAGEGELTEEANVVSISIVRDPLPNTDENGLFNLSILTPLFVFSDDSRTNARIHSEMSETAYITMKTDDDIIVPPPPEGFNPMEEEPGMSKVPGVREWHLESLAVLKRSVIWQAIDICGNPFVKEMIKAYIVWLYDTYPDKYDKTTTSIKASVETLNEYLAKENVLDDFYSALAPDFEELSASLVKDNIEKHYGGDSKITVGEKSTRLIKEYFEKLDDYNETLKAIVKEKGLGMDSQTLMVLCDRTENSHEQLIKEVSEELMSSKASAACQEAIFEINKSLLAENGLLEDDDIGIEELRELPEYKRMAKRTISIISNFLGV
jgi:hypothetical protein